MLDALRAVVASDRYMPHGHCYLWEPAIVWTHVISDWLIGAAYVGISLTLYALVRRIQLPFSMMFVAFGLFIGACGLTHFMEIWTMWQPYYWLEGGIKVITAAASIATAVLLVPLRPKVVALARSGRLAEERRLELERKNRELEVLYARMKEADELKSRFFANVSHELRTPLALLLGPVERMLERPSIAADDRRDLELVRRNAHLLLKQINDLLEVARLEAGRQEARYVAFDFAAFVRTTAAHFDAVARDRQIDFTVRTPDELRLEGDPDKLERVVVNLLSNALKFTPDGGKVRVSLEVRGDQARLEVADSGPGVREDLREVIFERFRQADSGTTRRYGGTGLGLAIARDFAELHDGGLTAGLAPEGGALFTFTLPLHAHRPVEVASGDVAAATVTGALEELHRTEPEAEVESVMRPEAATVLVVEDNPDLRQFLTSLLREDYNVDTAADGKEGLEKALALQPDLVLTDVMMPEMGGDELVRELRRRDETHQVPVLVLSARAEPEMRLNLLETGAQDYLSKPFSRDELRARVRNLVSISRTRKVLQQEVATHTGSLEQLARDLGRRTQELQLAVETARVAREQAERSSQVKTIFLGMVSHELRTPLTAMQLNFASLKRRKEPALDDRQKEALARLERSMNRLSEIIESILTYTQIESGRLLVQAEQIELPPLLQEVVEEIRPQAQMKLLDLRLLVPADLPRLESDPRLVRLIVMNLISNAIKYTDKGFVEVRAGREDGEHVLEVRDTGPGIPEEAHQRVFQPFEQLEPLRRKHTPGVGLGLALVREMAVAVGGRVDLRSRQGEGSTFIVHLPSTMQVVTGDQSREEGS